MPYVIEDDNSDCSGYAVVKEGTDEVLGCHDTLGEAEDQIAALYAAEADKEKHMILRKNYEVASFKTLPDEDGKRGRFEAIVAVYGNVDYQGDRVMPGAFKDSIQRWRDRGDPIPIIWSHDWGDPFAHIGFADPNEVEEVEADGKALEAGGLKIRGQIDLDTPFAAQVYRLMRERRVREFSFGYDVIREKPGADRANELYELDLIEVGPTLKGANPSTQLLEVKSLLEHAAEVERETILRGDIDAGGARRLQARWERIHEPSAMGYSPDDRYDPSLLEGMEDLVEAISVAAKSESSPSGGRDGGGKAVDESDWDGDAAMRRAAAADDPEAAFRAIAFERDNDSDADTAAHWALAHHANPGDPPNKEGVSAALAALAGARGGAPDLKDAGAARAHLEEHRDAIAEELADEDEKSTKAGAKLHGEAFLAGSWEETEEQLRSAIEDWAADSVEGFDVGERGRGWVHLIGTFPDKVTATVWLPAGGDSQSWQFGWSFDDGGEIALTDPVEVEVDLVITQRPATTSRGAKVGRVLSKANEDRIRSAADNLAAVLAALDKEEEIGGAGRTEADPIVVIKSAAGPDDEIAILKAKLALLEV